MPTQNKCVFFVMFIGGQIHRDTHRHTWAWVRILKYDGCLSCLNYFYRFKWVSVITVRRARVRAMQSQIVSFNLWFQAISAQINNQTLNATKSVPHTNTRIQRVRERVCVCIAYAEPGMQVACKTISMTFIVELNQLRWLTWHRLDSIAYRCACSTL